MSTKRERRQRGLYLAAMALNRARADDWERVNGALSDLNAELGGPGMMLAIVGWCDTLIAAYRKATGSADDAPVRPAWVNADTGDVDTDAGDVPVPARWAGRLIAARAALDEPAWDALMAVLPHDQAGLREHIAALLSTVAMTLNALNGAAS